MCDLYDVDLDIFLQMSHRLKRKQFSICQVEPPDPKVDVDLLSASQVEIIPDIIEVTGEITDEEKLQLYFEGKRSGGDSSKDIEWVKSIDGKILVKFANAEGIKFLHVIISVIIPKMHVDAAVVIAKQEHAIKGKRIYVCYAQPKQKDNDKIVIKNIPQECKVDNLEIFLESQLDLDATDFSIDLKSCCAIVYFARRYTDQGT